MFTHHFRLIVPGIGLTDSVANRLFAAGCGDATLSMVEGQLVAEFARKSISFDRAVASAIADVKKSGFPVVYRPVQPKPSWIQTILTICFFTLVIWLAWFVVWIVFDRIWTEPEHQPIHSFESHP